MSLPASRRGIAILSAIVIVSSASSGLLWTCWESTVHGEDDAESVLIDPSATGYTTLPTGAEEAGVIVAERIPDTPLMSDVVFGKRSLARAISARRAPVYRVQSRQGRHLDSVPHPPGIHGARDVGEPSPATRALGSSERVSGSRFDNYYVTRGPPVWTRRSPWPGSKASRSS